MFKEINNFLFFFFKGCDGICGRVSSSRSRRGIAGMVLGEGIERLFRGVPFPLLRFTSSGRNFGTCVETQNSALRNALSHPSRARIHLEGKRSF